MRRTASSPGTAGPRRALRALVCAAAALAVGLGVAELIAAVTIPSATPLIALGEVVIDVVPPPLKDTAIALFGTRDKLALITVAVLVAGLLAWLAGLLALADRPRLRTAGTAVVGMLGAVGAVAAYSRPDGGALALLPSLLGAAVSMPVLTALARRARAAEATEGAVGAEAGQPGRRALLARAGLTLAAGLGALVVGRTVIPRFRSAGASRTAFVLPPVDEPAPPLPAGVSPRVPGLPPFVTPNAEFYRIDTALVVPRVDAAQWQVRIHGLVEREVTLDLAQLLEQPMVERYVTLMCVSSPVGGDLTGNARWLGARIAPLLAQAGPLAEADMVLSRSVDGWTCSTPLEVLTDPGRDCLFAVGMNGEPLPFEHGFPVRMVVPGLYGYVSATKWVVDLEVTRFDRAEGYWTPRGWSARGPIKTQSRIDVPRDYQQIASGPAVLAGTAWAQHRGIQRVEVRMDEGPWRRAELAAEAGVDTWRQWVHRWEATPGRHWWQVRAFDATGTPQTAQQAPPAPDGATGYHTVQVLVEDA